MRIASLLPFSLTLCLAAGSALAADGAPRQSLNFTVLRNGEEVGTHVLHFRTNPDQSLRVSVDTNVVVKMAMIPVYRFEHHGNELWRDGHLSTLTSETNDDGTHHTLNVAETGNVLSVTGDGKAERMTTDMLPASLWNNGTVQRQTLMNTLDGHAMAVRMADMGNEEISAGGRTVQAHHYAMTGDLSRELWYDASGTLVQVRFKAKDDSDIRYVLR